MAGSQVPGFSTTFSGQRPLFLNFPSGKERKVVNFLEGKLSPTNAKYENSRGKVGAQVVRSRGEAENQVLKRRKVVEARARAPAGIHLLANQHGHAGRPTIPLGSLVHPPVLLRAPRSKGVLSRDPAVQQFPDLYPGRSGRCRVVRVKGRMVIPA